MKRNWGWGMMIALAVFIGGSMVWAVYAFSHDVDLVRSDYYESSLKYDETMAARLRAERLNASASIDFDRSDHVFVVRIPQSQAAGAVGTITLYRPNASSQDRTLPLAFRPDGTMTIPAAGFSPGIWELTANWTYAGNAYQLLATRRIGA